MNDSVPVPRTCTEIGEDGNDADGNERTALAFEKFRDVEAYVLLGAPGAGKTTTFKQEAACSDACHVTARDFITFDDRPEWHGKMLFIDGLDEMRAGSSDGRTTLDKIRNKLDQLGRPRFRLSCREADWFGANDRNNLKDVSPKKRITVLHLDPLTDENIREILNNTIDDPESFINEARRRGLEALLENPQSLWMLTKAFSKRQWPETRAKTFEMACKTLLREHNEEHRVARRDGVDIPSLLEIAGRLCAIQLLTDKAGYTLPGTESNPEYPDLEEIHGSDRAALRHVLGTKLFEAPAEGRAKPVHRHIAEFLGGRYLAGLVENGLPVGRILALITGDDGGVVSNLRGLSAWLATHSPPTSRRDIIERDPIGTVLYGDVGNFSVEEKRRLLNGLVRESQNGLPDWRNPRFGDLATREMRDVFREMLTSAKRDEPHQRLVMVLVKVLRYGTVILELKDVVLRVVRDKSWYPSIRKQALYSLLSQRTNAELRMKLLTDVHEGSVSDPDGDSLGLLLMKLLRDVHEGSVPDRDGDLLGLLLDALYPSWLSASDILQYLQMPGNGDGAYHRYFWNNVANRLKNAERAELLDRLVEQRLKLRKNILEHQEPENPAIKLPSRLLAGFLNESHEDIAPERLFGWLGLAALDFEDFPLSNPSTRFQDQDSVQQIRNWLTTHPETHKAMIALCVEDCRGKGRLFRTPRPPDFGSWYLEQAMRATDDTAATWYIREAADSAHAEGAIRQPIEELLAHHPFLEKAFRDRLSEREQQNTTHDGEEDNHPASPELLKFRDEVKKHIPALRENRCPPRLLDRLAKAYFGLSSDVDGNTPEKNRLHNLLEDDDLVETTLAAFRDSINRSDVPTDTEILRLREENRRHLLEHPCLAGLKRSQPEGLFDEKQMRQALAFYYNSQALLYDGRPDPRWYQRLLANHPEMVSRVLVEFVRSDIRRKREHCFAVNNLAFLEEYRAVARLAVPPLLKSFPVRCTSSQLGILNVLLTAALRHCEENAFVALIEHKLSLSSLDVAQRVYWLATGLFASPARYRPKIEAYLSGHERRIRHLAVFLTDYNDRSTWSTLLSRLDVQTLALLIRLVGGSYRPLPDSTAQMRPAELVTAIIYQLATLPSPDATTALESLSSDEALHSWRSGLVNAALQQRAVRRETNFQHQDIPTVLRTLDNLAPANAADLAALTTDILSKIARRIRDGNTSDWRQYWNVNSHNQPECPKPEDACRDALLSDLQLRLQPLGIDAQPEGRYANDNRADIRVTYGDFNVPVEIKRNNHRDLWHAIKEQLIAKYTRDPGADGRGIYLVFWFGTEECQKPLSGRRPGSASKLEEHLRNMLSEEEQAKISILVIDVSKCENEG